MHTWSSFARTAGLPALAFHVLAAVLFLPAPAGAAGLYGRSEDRTLPSIADLSKVATQPMGSTQSKALQLESGWSAYGEGYSPPTVSASGELVVVSGLVRASSGTWGHIATLPADLRPSHQLVFNLNNDTDTTRVDVLPDGRIVYVAGGHGHGWLSLSGITFVRSAGTGLTPATGWRSVGPANNAPYRPASVTLVGDLVVASGLVEKAAGGFTPGERIVMLPEGARPAKPLIFNVNGHGQTQRVNVGTDGGIYWTSGGHDYNWVSLDGITFSAKPGTTLALAPGNTPYDANWAAPQASRIGDLVTVSGLLKPGNLDQPVATLPAALRPVGRMIFNLGSDGNPIRVDVLPNGEVRHVAGTKDIGWLNLSGIAFPLGIPTPVVAAPPAPPAPPTAAPVVVAKPVGPLQRQPLPLASGWSAYGQGYSPPTATKSGNLVTVSGLARAASSQWSHVATLPAGWRPPYELVFNLNNDAATMRVDVFPDGRIMWMAGGHGTGWLSLSGITFSTESGTPLALGQGWRDFGPANRTIAGPASVTRTGDFVVVSGLVEKPAGDIKPGDVIATLPAGARPAQSLIFNVNGESKTQRLDVGTDGRIYWTNGGHDYNWVSLDGIQFSAAAGTSLALAPGNAPYGGGWMAPQAARIGDMVTVSGLLKPGDLDQPVAMLPAGLRPAGRMIFNVGSDGNPIRLDLLPSGEVRHVAGTRAIGWLNLSGVAFPLGIATPADASPTASTPVAASPTASPTASTPVAASPTANTPAAPAAPKSPLLDAARSLAASFPGLSSGWSEWEKRFSQQGELFRAEVTIASQPATIVVYRPVAGRAAVNIAVLASNLTIGHLIKPAAGTPADDLVVDNAAYIYVPGGSYQRLDLSALPPVVRDQVSKSRTGPIELIEGQNLYALVNPRDGGTTAQLLKLVGAPMENLKVSVGYGNRREKDKPVPWQSVRLTRAGTWSQPFYLKDTALENPTIELAKTGNETTMRAWGTGSVKQKPYFVFLQKVGNRGSLPTAAALDASTISLKDYKDIALVFGETVLSGTGQSMQNLLDGIDQVPLDEVEIANPKYTPGGAMDADNNPDFTNVLVMAAAPGDVLPDAARTEGPIMLAHGDGKVFGFTAGKIDGWVRSTSGMDVKGAVNLPSWPSSLGMMTLGQFNLALYRDGRSYDMDLRGRAAVKYLFSEDVTLKASNRGFSFDIAPNCPRIFGFAGSIDSHAIGQGTFSLSKVDGDPLACLTGPLKELSELLKKGVEQVAVGASVVKGIGDDAWAGLVKEGGGAVSPEVLANLSRRGISTAGAMLTSLGGAGEKVFDDIGDTFGGFFGGSDSGGEKPRYFNKPSVCGPYDNWSIKWGTCWRRGHELLRMGDYCLSVDGRKKIKDRDVQIEKCHGDWNQQWRWFPATGEIKHGWGEDHCMDSGSKEPSSVAGRKIEQNACNGEGDQRFYRDRYDRLTDRDGFCLEFDRNESDAAVRLQTCKLDGSGTRAHPAQKVTFAPDSAFTALGPEQGCPLVRPDLQWNPANGKCEGAPATPDQLKAMEQFLKRAR